MSITKWWVRMLNIYLKMSLLAILQHLHWLCWCHRSLLLWNEKIWYSCFLQLHQGSITNMVIDAAFSFIVIMLQTKFLFVRVHSLVILKILLRKFLKCEHINNFMSKSWDLITTESEWPSLHMWNKNSCDLEKCSVFILLHIRCCCPLNSVCLQNLKFYASL